MRWENILFCDDGMKKFRARIIMKGLREAVRSPKSDDGKVAVQ